MDTINPDNLTSLPIVRGKWEIHPDKVTYFGDVVPTHPSFRSSLVKLASSNTPVVLTVTEQGTISRIRTICYKLGINFPVVKISNAGYIWDDFSDTSVFVVDGGIVLTRYSLFYNGIMIPVTPRAVSIIRLMYLHGVDVVVPTAELNTATGLSSHNVRSPMTHILRYLNPVLKKYDVPLTIQSYKNKGYYIFKKGVKSVRKRFADSSATLTHELAA